MTADVSSEPVPYSWLDTYTVDRPAPSLAPRLVAVEGPLRMGFLIPGLGIWDGQLDASGLKEYVTMLKHMHRTGTAEYLKAVALLDYLQQDPGLVARIVRAIRRVWSRA